MDAKKMQRWAKWHGKGYRMFMLTHLAAVCGFYGFGGAVAYTQLYMTMPESVKRHGGGLPIWPAVFVVGIMTPLSIVWSHYMWKRNEAQYEEFEKGS